MLLGDSRELVIVPRGTPQRLPRGEAYAQRSAARQFSCIPRIRFVRVIDSPGESKIWFPARAFDGTSGEAYSASAAEFFFGFAAIFYNLRCVLVTVRGPRPRIEHDNPRKAGIVASLRQEAVWPLVAFGSPVPHQPAAGPRCTKSWFATMLGPSRFGSL